MTRLILLTFLAITINICHVNCSIIGTIAQKSAEYYKTYATSTGQKQNIANNTVQDNIVLPGRIGVGYDPLAKQIVLPVIEMTYNEENNWKNYLIPDQVTLLFNNIQKNTTQTFNTINDWYQQYRPNGNKINQGEYAILQDINEMANIGFSSDTSMIVTQNIYNLYGLNLKENYKLDNFFQEALNMLPENYEEDIYFELFKYWGTDFVSSGNFGGMCDRNVAVKSCIFGGNMIPASQAEMELLSDIYPSYDKVNLDGSYLSRRQKTSITIYGGDPTITDYENRLKTFLESPAILDFTTIPIHELADIKNQTIKQNIIKAYNNYKNNIINNEQQTLQQAFKNTNTKTIYMSEGWDTGTHPYFKAEHNKYNMYTDVNYLAIQSGNSGICSPDSVSTTQCKIMSDGSLQASVQTLLYLNHYIDTTQQITSTFGGCTTAKVLAAINSDPNFCAGNVYVFWSEVICCYKCSPYTQTFYDDSTPRDGNPDITINCACPTF